MDTAFKYIEKTALVTETEYPYTAKNGKCKSLSGLKAPGTVSNYQDVQHNSVDQLKKALTKGPVSIAIEADKAVFQQYTGGVISGSRCGKQLDHGVLAVGYGTDPKFGPYFKVKNSWGASWGDNGYVKIAATSSNVCGILSSPSYPSA